MDEKEQWGDFFGVHHVVHSSLANTNMIFKIYSYYLFIMFNGDTVLVVIVVVIG